MASGGYTLTYFDIRGLAEVARLTLAAAGQKFTDDRIAFTRNDDGTFTKVGWEERKKAAPYGQVPTLTIEDGTIIPQSGAIVRFIAKRHNLAGANDVEAALIDAAYEHLCDVRKSYFTAKGDAAKVAAFWETGLSESLRLLANNVQGELYIARSNALSYSDIAAYYTLFVLRTENAEAVDKAIAANPKIAAIYEAVPKTEKIAAYLAQRKETPM